ncbi:DUF1702 family protein [Nonomuraea sp. NPDC047897]|uniref:DUF1702 family protein n=1 Tax=Nonomuraea sp. NPDC047897 TaxID=3364346 RepID=UPI0037150293
MGETGTSSYVDRVRRLGGPARGWRGLLARDPGEADLARRRFRLGTGPSQAAIETAERAYVSGFNAALTGEPGTIEEMPPDRRPFAYEGAGAACTVLDLLTLARGRRLRDLLGGPAGRHAHAVHLGAGRGYALLRLRPLRGAGRAHPLLRWLAVDGYGFQRGLDGADRMVGERTMPDLLTRAHCATFDQGLGRLLWYHDGACPDGVAAAIAGYPAGRRADLWSGVGFAATHTGGAEPEELSVLAERAGADGFRAHLAQGCAFAAAARVQAGPLDGPHDGPLDGHVARAAPVLAGVAADEAAAWADRALLALGHDPRTHDDFLTWQADIRRFWSRRRRR